MGFAVPANTVARGRAAARAAAQTIERPYLGLTSAAVPAGVEVSPGDRRAGRRTQAGLRSGDRVVEHRRRRGVRARRRDRRARRPRARRLGRDRGRARRRSRAASTSSWARAREAVWRDHELQSPPPAPGPAGHAARSRSPTARLRPPARARRLPRSPARALLPSVAPRRPRWRRHVPYALYALALAGLALALARPEITVAVPGRAGVDRARHGHVGIDAGHRRRRRRGSSPRATPALELPRRRSRARCRVGAVIFNHTIRSIEPPTSDRDAVRQRLERLRPRGSIALRQPRESAPPRSSGSSRAKRARSG